MLYKTSKKGYPIDFSYGHSMRKFHTCWENRFCGMIRIENKGGMHLEYRKKQGVFQ